MNIKQFHAHATPYLLKLNDKKYHLKENNLLKFLEEDRLYKVYQAYLKEEEIKHSNKELNKFLDYYCQVISSKKIKNALTKFNKNNSLIKVAFALGPIVSAAITTGAIWLAAAAVQAIAEEFKNANNLIEAAEEIIEQLTEYNQDYGFGEAQKQADRLASNLRTLISLHPTVSVANFDQNSSPAQIQKFSSEASKFLTALYESEKDVIVINSYLTEHKGFGTHSAELVRTLGVSLGVIETDTISLVRAIGNFQSHSGACRIKIEKKLSEIQKKMKPQIERIQMEQSQGVPAEGFAEESEENLTAQQPRQAPVKSVKQQRAEPTQQEFDDEISEFANMEF